MLILKYVLLGAFFAPMVYGIGYAIVGTVAYIKAYRQKKHLSKLQIVVDKYNEESLAAGSRCRLEVEPLNTAIYYQGEINTDGETNTDEVVRMLQVYTRLLGRQEDYEIKQYLRKHRDILNAGTQLTDYSEAFLYLMLLEMEFRKSEKEVNHG